MEDTECFRAFYDKVFDSEPLIAYLIVKHDLLWNTIVRNVVSHPPDIPVLVSYMSELMGVEYYIYMANLYSIQYDNTVFAAVIDCVCIETETGEHLWFKMQFNFKPYKKGGKYRLPKMKFTLVSCPCGERNGIIDDDELDRFIRTFESLEEFIDFISQSAEQVLFYDIEYLIGLVYLYLRRTKVLLSTRLVLICALLYLRLFSICNCICSACECGSPIASGKPVCSCFSIMGGTDWFGNIADNSLLFLHEVETYI